MKPLKALGGGGLLLQVAEGCHKQRYPFKLCTCSTKLTNELGQTVYLPVKERCSMAFSQTGGAVGRVATGCPGHCALE